MNGENIVILLVIGVLLSAAALFLLYRQWGRLEETQSKLPKWMLFYAGIILLSLIGITAIKISVYQSDSMTDIARDMIIVSLLWVAAATDKKFYKIPNMIILAGLGYWILMTLYEVIAQTDTVWFNVMSELIAVVILAVIIGLCLLLMKNSIGMGDFKLILIMAAFLGLSDVLTAIFASLLVSFFVSVALLVRKAKTRQDSIPFAPFMLAGTMLAIIMTGI